MRYFSVRPQFNGLRPPRMTGRKSELVDRLKQMVVDIKRSTGKSSIFPCPPGPQTARRCAPIMRPSPATTIPNHRSQPVKHVVPRSASSHSHGHNQNKGAGGLPSEHDRQALTLTQTPEYTARRNPFHKVKSLLRTRMLGYGETKILSFYISSQMMARTKRALAPGQEYAAGDTIITIRGFQEVQKRYEEFNSFYRIQVNNDYVTIPPPKKKTKKAAKGFDIPKEINISAQVRPNQINTIKISYSPYHYHYTVFKGAITVELVEYQTADSLSKLVPVNKTISSKPAVTTTAATTTIPLPPVVSASAPAPVPATTTPSVTNSVTGKVYNPAWLALKRQYINNINNDNKYSNYIDHATIYEPRVMEMTPEQAEELKLRVQQSDQSKFCAVCSIRRDDLMRCSRCKLRWYCGVEHQRLHWGVHKGECRPPTLEEEKNRKEVRTLYIECGLLYVQTLA